MAVVVLVAASAALAAPAAGADTDALVIESANGTERVWQQTRWDDTPTITEDFRDSPNQYWVIRDNGTIRNVGTGLCAAAVGGGRLVSGRDCDSADSRQRWRVLGDHNQKMIQNEEFGNCVTYEGNEDQLLLRGCDSDRINQRWYLND